MTDHELIHLLEKTTGLALNEESVKSLIDDRLSGLLTAAPRRLVLGSEAPGPALGLSRFLGEVRRLGMGQPGRHAEDLVRVEPSFKQMLPHQAKDLREGLASAGGYLAPAESAGEVLNLLGNFSAIKSLCREVPMRSHQITFPTLAGGLSAYWVPEASDTSSSDYDPADGFTPRGDATFGQMAITAQVLAVKVVVSNQLLDDSDPKVDQVLGQIFAETLAAAFDRACLTGAGSATDPISGLLTRITSNALNVTGDFGFDHLADLIFKVYENAPHAQEVPVVGHAKAEKLLMKLKDDQGDYIYRQPGQPRAEGDTRPRVWGEPFVRDPNLPTNLGAGGNQTALVAGDFATSAFVGLRQGLVVKTNPWAEPYFSYNQTCFLAEARLGFALSDEKRFAKLSGVPTA
ncbi:MAG: phage major capsid protein [Desulfarculus sp.]|nr:phage major capsid protein [Desulfarculus sp.]